jgi:hypothetical protein|tara:strand:- start:32 stop:151 length:120 start_codon:yes stop_codon:yes gene_type:complete
MRLGNTVEFTHVALGLIPEIFNAIGFVRVNLLEPGRANL